ncbi:MAG: DUF3800 domain-containing protein [Thermodesulfobacteriota bacterium]
MGYTLYVDEVGHASFKGISPDKERYLSLTGLVIDRDEVHDYLIPQMDALKNVYCPPGTQPHILHRNDIVNKRYPFHGLGCSVICRNFDTDLLSLINGTTFVAVTVVLDKIQMARQYKYLHHPYHYCLKLLLERYVRILEARADRGDVIVERRGGKEDRMLITEFAALRERGTDYIKSARIKAVLTSANLKLRTKKHNVAGLQLADIVAHPSFKLILALRNGKSPPSNFGGKVANILENHKYYRGQWGKIEGYGRKWLP